MILQAGFQKVNLFIFSGCKKVAAQPSSELQQTILHAPRTGHRHQLCTETAKNA